MDIKQVITDQIIAQIDAGVPAWRKPWKNGLNKNPATGTVYKPGNQVILQAAGHSDPRWYTPAWCKENKIGFKGAKLRFIATAFMSSSRGSKADDEHSELVAEEGAKFLRLSQMGVFNAENLTGLPSLEEYLGVPKFQAWEIIEELATQMIETGLRIDHTGQRACYSIKDDKISMPQRALFLSVDDYYSTLLHEMVHATGHPSRLNRELANKFGSEAYAFEELIAELGAAQSLATFRGTPSQTSIGAHAAYIAGWSKILKSSKDAIFTASARAFEATQWLSNLMPEQLLLARSEVTVEIDKPRWVLTPSF
jgi:antirestriction protein ArdC